MCGRVDGHVREPGDDLLGHRVDLDDLLHHVAPKAHPQGVVVVGRPHLEALAPHPELAAGEADVVALVVDLHQLREHLVAADVVALLEQHHLPQILSRRTQAVDARDRSHDDHIVAHEQTGGGRVPQAVDLLVDGGVLLDVCVCGREIGLRLVVVVVGDEVLDRAVREELPELIAELRRQSLVGSHDQCRLARLGDQVGHGEGLTRAGHPEQGLEAVAAPQPLRQLGQRLGLVTLELVLSLDLKYRHRSVPEGVGVGLLEERLPPVDALNEVLGLGVGDVVHPEVVLPTGLLDPGSHLVGPRVVSGDGGDTRRRTGRGGRPDSRLPAPDCPPDR